MYLFLIFPLTLLAYLFFSIRRIAPGKRGSIVALVLLSITLLCFMFRTNTIACAGQAVFVIWVTLSLLAFLLLDVCKLVRRIAVRKPFEKQKLTLVSRGVLAATFIATAIFLAYGVPHNENYIVRDAKVALPAGSEKFDMLYFSDLHMDPLFSASKLERMVHEADSVRPDFIVFGGDLADITDSALTAKGFDKLFRELVSKAKVGAFGVTGNHEAYMESQGSNPAGWMRNVGMVVLEDSTACTPKACFSGRVDFQVARMRDLPRRALAEFAPDTALPWILVDHQPKGLEQEYSGKMPTIALSGHTHDGQFFPVTVLIDLFWRLSYGFGELDGSKWLVTSGIDSWGPPVRVGSDTELWHLFFE